MDGVLVSIAIAIVQWRFAGKKRSKHGPWLHNIFVRFVRFVQRYVETDTQKNRLMFLTKQTNACLGSRSLCISLLFLSYPILSCPMIFHAILSAYFSIHACQSRRAGVSFSRQTNTLLFCVLFFFLQGVTTDQGLLCLFLVAT